MKPDDILNAIGEVDESYIKKAHQKSFLKAFLVFVIIVIVSCTILVSRVPDFNLLLRYNPDGSVNTGYAEPEVLIHNKWTSMEYTAYADGEVVGTTEFRIALNPNYTITHTENGTVTKIVGSNGDTLWPNDYLGDQNYTNLYISTLYSTDLMDRIDSVYINSEAAYGILNQQLNCIRLEYFERSDLVNRQTLLKSGRTPQEAVIGIRGYDHQNTQITGWKEWDAEYNLLAYAEYAYDRNMQTVSTHLADGTLTGTRVSKYSFGHLRWREHYNAEGNLVGREVYRYRPWEIFFCLEGFFALLVILSLAATAAIAVWDDRIQFGTRLVRRAVTPTQDDTIRLVIKVDALKAQIARLSDQIQQADREDLRDELAAMQEELRKMNDYLCALLSAQTDQEESL